MRLIKKFIGQNTYCKSIGKLIEINEDNVPILKNNNKGFLFTDGDELHPIVKDEPAEVKTEKATVASVDETEKAPLNKGVDPEGFDRASYTALLEKVSIESLNEFADREASEVKTDLDKLGVEYPKNGSRKMLAEIVKRLK